VRIFVATLTAGEIAITGDEHHYLGRVRRARVGDLVELHDGSGRRARATITKITATTTMVTADRPELVVEPGPTIAMLIPPIKGDRMDLCIEKLVEVGVDDIVVWPAARAVVKLAPDKLEARLAHYRGIAQAAARQSTRTTIPTIRYAGDLAGAVSTLPAVASDDPKAAARFVLDPAADTPLVGSETASSHVAMVSGPEGGLTNDELEWLADRAFIPSSLGPRVLRAETAPVIAVAIVRHQRFVAGA